jgi:diguanylate cyclase (GGDEF)-like protein
MIGCGALAWGGLVFGAGRLGFGTAATATPLVYAVFLLVIVATRSMAFRMIPETPVSLDSAFYIAAAACLGSVSAGWLVAVALTLDTVLRLGFDDPSPRRRGVVGPLSRIEGSVYVFYYGGLTGALVLGVGWVLGVDSRPLSGRFDAELQVMGRVFALGISLLAAHYFVQGVRLRLTGLPPAQFLRRMAFPGMLAEASLLPLSVVLVLIYDSDRPIGLVLLGATYLVVNFIFNRLSHTSESLRQRVGELETLNRTAKGLGATLQLHELIESLARETLAAVPVAELFALSRLEPPAGSRKLVVDVYDRDRGEFTRHAARADADEGPTAWVIERRETLAVGDLGKAGPELGFSAKNDPGVRSWLGVPIVIYDEVVGVLSVQSFQRNVFGPDHRRVLEAIGAQAAVAIQNARLYELATVDGLTGLYVRRYFDSRLREELERSKRFTTPFSVILLDIDDFKKLNDTHGHAVGDRVLREVAQSMRRNMRGVDIAARYGGEEFAFILPRTAMIDAHAVAERIRADLTEVRIVASGLVVPVTASLGVASYPDSGAADAAQLLERADVALYRAKATGKNRVELFWGADESGARKRGTL